MAEYLTVETLASYPGVALGSDETNDLVVLLDNGLITDILGAFDDFVGTYGVALPTRVTSIALEVAARALRNPEGYSSVTKQIDDWKKTTRRESDDAAGATGVYLTEAEEAYLYSLIASTPQPGAGSIRLRVPGYAHPC